MRGWVSGGEDAAWEGATPAIRLSSQRLRQYEVITPTICTLSPSDTHGALPFFSLPMRAVLPSPLTPLTWGRLRITRAGQTAPRGGRLGRLAAHGATVDGQPRPEMASLVVGDHGA